MKKIKKYFLEVISELKKVTWPTKKQTIDKTLIVIGVSVAVAIYLGGLDYLFQRIMELLIST
jgi:preprotein translocase subunit SecE